MVRHRENDILTQLSEKVAQTVSQNYRAVILQPGAIGDCVLTLPLAKFMKQSLGLGGVDVVGHAEYIGYMPGRTCIDGIRSIDSLEFHRLFAEPDQFHPPEKDPLIWAFADYSYIVSFMGDEKGWFEQNLIFVANCSRSVEVVVVELKPESRSSEHISSYYVRQFAETCDMKPKPPSEDLRQQLIEPTETDAIRGRQILEKAGAGACAKPVVLAPGSGGAKKCWHPQNFLQLAGELQTQNIDVLFLLGPAEIERFNPRTLEQISHSAPCVRNASISDVVALLSCADAFVGNDSGITHISGGMGVKTLAVFGPTNPAVFRPVGPDTEVFRDFSGIFATQPNKEMQHKVLNALAQ